MCEPSTEITKKAMKCYVEDKVLPKYSRTKNVSAHQKSYTNILSEKA